MISQTELVKLSTISGFELHNIIIKTPFKQGLIWRRDIQKALTEYSKHNKMDSIQEDITSVLKRIESTLFRTFRDHRMAYHMRECGYKIDAAKIRLKQEWEGLLKKESY
jgi:hypothetical protein